MGIDITFFVEELSPQGKWKLAEKPLQNPYYDPEDPTDFELLPNAIEINRNRVLFGVLANVNRYGLICEGDIIPICNARGLPVDAPELTRKMYESAEGFSAGWLTPDEITSFDWSQIVQHTAYVDPAVQQLFEGNPLGFPYDKWPQDLPICYSGNHFSGVRVRWRETYFNATGYKYLYEEIKLYMDSEKYRFVFWFDE